MTTVTKKTSLLPGLINVTFTNVIGCPGTTDMALNCAHLDALQGAEEHGGDTVSAPVTIKREGKADETITIGGIRTGGSYTGNASTPFVAGETFIVEATVDPAKTQYRQGKVVGNGTV